MATLTIAGAVAVNSIAFNTETAIAADRIFSANLEPSARFVPSDARGRAKFWLTDEDTQLHYEIAAKKVQLVTQIHIHLNPEVLTRGTPRNKFQKPAPRKHGPIVTFLMERSPKGVTVDGVVATGVISDSDLIGPLRGNPLSVLIELMENADTYIAMHVLMPVPPNQTFCCPVGLRGVVHEEQP